MRSFIDQTGYAITIPYPPKRIISLVPSQTDLLSDLGLVESVVGITKFCIHPSSWLSTKASIGGTKNFRFDVIEALKPDLIIGNKEENYREGIEYLREKFPVWMSDITTMDEAIAMIQAVGLLTNTEYTASAIAHSIQQSFRRVSKFKKQSVLYMIWRQPWMAAGSETFINSILETIGLSNAITERRYPHLMDDVLRTLHPDYVFLSSEPYPFQGKHIEEIQELLPSSKILLVDGEMFSWYGSRLLKAPDYFTNLLIS